MALTNQQLELRKKYSEAFTNEIERFRDAPEELQAILDTVWTHLEASGAIQDEASAQLAAVNTLVHLRDLSHEFQPEDLQTLIDLLIGSGLAK